MLFFPAAPSCINKIEIVLSSKVVPCKKGIYQDSGKVRGEGEGYKAQYLKIFQLLKTNIPVSCFLYPPVGGQVVISTIHSRANLPHNNEMQ